MPGYRPRRGAARGARGRPRGAATAIHGRNGFKASRLKEQEDDPAQDVSSADDSGPGAYRQDNEDVESSSEVEEEVPRPTNSYLTLLQSLNSKKDGGEPARKRRKTENGTRITHSVPDIVVDVDVSKELEEDIEEEENEQHEGPQEDDEDSEDEESILRDPFEQHYAATTDHELKTGAKQVDEKQWQTQSSLSDNAIRRTNFFRKDTSSKVTTIKSMKDLFLKQRLAGTGSKVVSTLSSDQKFVASSIFNYTDVINGCRELKSTTELRDLACLHALNHVFKTRDRVLKNNTRLSMHSGSDALDLRDQGFTRPKVLFVVPTKQACVRFVDSIVKLSEPDQQENKARFLETFSHDDKDEWLDKPEDFRQLFGGNHEEDFRIGLKFTRKTIKYFSGFYNSDIIIGSPLGLMRTITTGGGGGKDKKKAHDADFLSSIEVAIVDHANALQMQNWQHVDYVFSQLNLLPKDSHGCDFSRVRHWYLDGQAKYLRQTIILSDFLTPEINALTSAHLHNISGRIRLQPTYTGAMLSVSNLLPYALPQTFLRLSSPTALQDSDARFKYFTTTILPPLLRDSKHQKGILLFVPTYLDFVCLRNYLSTSADATSLSFGSISEYVERKDVLRARSHFLSGRHSMLLYSERAHHHFRYKIKGVRRIVFYGVPENPIFWTEIIALLGLSGEQGGKGGGGKGLVRALFSKWDAMKLERVVGTERVGKLINDRGGDVFDFV